MDGETHLIFGPYWDGAAGVYADPYRVHRRLVAALDGRPNEYLKNYRTDPEAKDRVLEAARVALDMVPFDKTTGRGATEADTEAALLAYLSFFASRGRRAATSPTSRSLTGCPGCPAP